MTSCVLGFYKSEVKRLRAPQSSLTLPAGLGVPRRGGPRRGRLCEPVGPCGTSSKLEPRGREEELLITMPGSRQSGDGPRTSGLLQDTGSDKQRRVLSCPVAGGLVVCDVRGRVGLGM